ncbi:hypothetical protein [Shewanella goraebulensis]|uniref:hypothetical protein n=1 Tax=Shewanella goraebulensis TaxID=3050637 RepID=UPI002551C3FD|nr:hypothetical protein [Shewanella goraebulensis]
MKTDTEETQVSKADNKQFKIQVAITILASILTIFGVNYQLTQEQKNWHMQRKVVMYEKLQDQKLESFKQINKLLADYKRAYQNYMYAKYFGSIGPEISRKNLELAKLIPERKEELESRAVEFSKQDLWKYSIKSTADALEAYRLAYDNLTAHIQYSIFFFSPESRGHMKNFSEYVSTSFIQTWPKLNYDLLLEKVTDGAHPWEALDSLTEHDLGQFSPTEFNKLQELMVMQMVRDIYHTEDFD